MTAFYNEIDPYAAAWLRELIKQGLIADGTVDTRSITEVQPADLKGYTQCHFFAGIGVWSHSLRAAGWDDSRPVWTGSCPCQPFSSAGKRLGTADERHLWPAFAKLIAECKPPAVFGEQVASGAGRDWLASVRADLEALGYAVGAADLCAAGTGAPHIRQRLYWVADAGCQLQAQHGGAAQQCDRLGAPSGDSRRSRLGGLADTHGGRQQGHGQQHGRPQQPEQPAPPRIDTSGCLKDGVFQPASGTGPSGHWGSGQVGSAQGRQGTQGHVATAHLDDAARGFPWSDSTKGFWANPDWIRCRDGKWRCVEPGTFPLVDGAPARVGRLRGYGNAIVAPVAETFIKAYLMCGA